MTISSIIILCAMISAFLLFGSVLAWGDFYSRGRPGAGAQASKPEPAAPPAPLRKAA